MMFIMVLSIGISNILMALPPLVDRRSSLAIGRLHLSWLVLLLLMHLNLFWQVLLILDIDDWTFPGFLYVVTGPVLLLLATSVLLPGTERARSDPDEDYRTASPPAFVFLAILMGWLVGFDFLFGDGLGLASTGNVVAAGILLFLARSSAPRAHAVGAALVWLVFLSLLTARGLGLTP